MSQVNNTDMPGCHKVYNNICLRVHNTSFLRVHNASHILTVHDIQRSPAVYKGESFTWSK